MSLQHKDPMRQRVIGAIAWAGAFKYLGQLLTWMITLFIVRLLSPDDYGLMAEAQVFIGLLTMLSELGLGAAIIQRNLVDKEQLSRAFALVLLSNAFLCLITVSVAPAVAHYFSEPRLISILRVLSITFLFISIYTIPQSMLYRTMNFKSKSVVDFISILVSALTTFVLAWFGQGVFSLVWGTLSLHFCLAVGYILSTRLMLRPKFNLTNMASFISFGGILTFSRILWYFYSQVDILIGGYFLGKAALGTYVIALQLSTIPLDKFLPLLTQVAFPAYSRIQTDMDLVRQYFLKSVQWLAAVLLPFSCGLFILAPKLVRLLLGEQWSEAIRPLQLLAIVLPLRGLNTLFAPALNGIGRADVGLFNLIIACLVIPVALWKGVQWNITGLCIAWIIGFALSFVMISIRSLSILGISLLQYVKCMRSAAISSAGMFVALTLLQHTFVESLSPLISIVFYAFVGVTLYVFFTFLTDRDSFRSYLALLKLTPNRA